MLNKALAPYPPVTVRINDACRMTGIGRSKLYLLINAGEIETIKVGTITLIPVESIDAFVAAKRSARAAH